MSSCPRTEPVSSSYPQLGLAHRCEAVGELYRVHKGSFMQGMGGKPLLSSAPKGFSAGCFPRAKKEGPSRKPCTLLDNKLGLAITAALLYLKVKNHLMHYSSNNLCSISVILCLPLFISYQQLHHYKHLGECVLVE